jgi:hypothetical protein
VLCHSASRSGRTSWPLAFTLVALSIAAVIVIIFWRIETWPARTAQQSTEQLEKVGKDLRDAFIDIAHLQPRITINNRVYVEQTIPVSELVVLSRRIDIHPNEIIVQLPHARILGVEQDQVDILAFENGLWNRISGEDMQSELSILPQLAREKAAESGLPAEAESALQQQIEQRVHPPQPVHLIFKGPTANEAQ